MHNTATTPPSGPTGDPSATAAPSIPETQRRILVILLASQVLSGVGLAAGVTVAALLAQDMLHSTTLAGLPSALLTAGSALAAVIIGRVSQTRGRRPGLAAGYLAGALGGAGVVVAAALDDPALLFISLFLYGAGTAANLQARYAGADLAAPRHRARALSTVLVATTVGGVVGPNLTAPAGRLATALALPPLSGLFLVSSSAFALAALTLLIWLRPDPLLLARTLPTEPEAAEAPERADAGAAPGPPHRTAHPRPGLPLGVLVMVLSQLVMVAIMTMTPVHMHDHGHSTAASGLVIALHVGAMYLPSPPLTGALTDRYGPTATAAASGLTLLAAGTLAATVPADSVLLLTLALILLGIGWNLGLVSGTTIITNAVPLATRAKTQGMVDVAIAIAGATGGMTSGIVVAAASYPLLALTGAAFALALLPAVIVTAQKSSPRTPSSERR
ncbi:MFS transporter [Streptomyces sp. AK010]|uniref:MFS transporter n=1 Tax=Streptomyces sp. AK010 TaxID=2723074 RepID=UPI00160A1AD9|nr:MFS transporter [Streptomyces sp. AK010]MBB6421115.1 MFS family permease [Streptomyces sp. AK010]